MASDGRAEFDPKEIARAAFPTAFRGYDQEAVRRYLSRLAAAVGRAQQLGLLGTVDQEDGASQVRVAELEQEAAELRIQVQELELLLQSQPAVDPAGADEVQVGLDHRQLDEAELIELLGHETARIVEAARSAASDIVQRAEDEAVSIRAQAAVDASSATERADEILTTARVEAEQLAAKAGAEAKKAQALIKAEAKRSRDQAQAQADKVVAEARTKAESDLSAARQRASQIVADAESLREEILGDLVRRRRTDLEQLEHLSAARDRLAQALAAARAEIDGVAAQIDLDVPDGAELDLTTDGSSPGEDRDDVAELVARLQTAGDATSTSTSTTANGAEPSPEVGAGTETIVAERPTEPEEAGNGFEPPGGASGLFDFDDELDLDDTMPLAITASPATENGSTVDGLDLDDDGSREAGPDVDPHPDPEPGPGADGDAGDGSSESEVPAVVAFDDESSGGVSTETYHERLVDLDGPIDGDRLLDHLGFAGDAVLGTDRGSMHRSQARGDLPRPAPYGGNLPAAIEARDIALTRSTAGFRRRLKRAVNDDQSDVLDRLRAGRGPIGADELPPLDIQLDGYVNALRPALRDVVEAGGQLLDHDELPEGAIENLCLQLAKHIVDCLRLPTIDAIEQSPDDDREAILDPVRAIYRDFRNALLPDLIEDALHEAFALGLYYAIDEDGLVIWMTDPRLDADPICEENSASPPIAKGDDFPSGHVRPLSMPGCRCLAIPAG